MTFEEVKGYVKTSLDHTDMGDDEVWFSREAREAVYEYLEKFDELLEIAAQEESIREHMCDMMAHFCEEFCEGHCHEYAPDKYCVDKWLEWRMEE